MTNEKMEQRLASAGEKTAPTKPTLFLFCKDRASSLPAPGTSTAGNGTTA